MPVKSGYIYLAVMTPKQIKMTFLSSIGLKTTPF